jgi:hypothetical protein
MVRRILLAGLAAGLVGAAGCRHCCGHRRDPLPPGGFLADPTAPRSGDLIPPPPGGLPSTVPPAADPGSGLPPPVIPDNTRNFRPDPARPGPQLLLPDPLPGMSSSAPRAGYGGGSDLPPRPASPARTAGHGPAAAGLPGFAVVKPGLATGRKPTAGGFDAVAARGFRVAVYLHVPADDVSAARDLAEKKGLVFVGIPTSPETLKAAFEKFRDVVADVPGRPAFVFDDDGVRAGGLWYLYFRTAEQLGDDAARVRAAPLGLREAGGDEQMKFWRAIQDYLAKR